MLSVQNDTTEYNSAKKTARQGNHWVFPVVLFLAALILALGAVLIYRMYAPTEYSEREVNEYVRDIYGDSWKLQKKTPPILKEWADMVFFCNYRTYVINVDGQGAVKGKNMAQGGERVIYTTHHNCRDAKNRFGPPDVLPLIYQSISNIISQASSGSGMEATARATCEPVPEVN